MPYIKASPNPQWRQVTRRMIEPITHQTLLPVPDLDTPVNAIARQVPQYPRRKQNGLNILVLICFLGQQVNLLQH